MAPPHDGYEYGAWKRPHLGFASAPEERWVARVQPAHPNASSAGMLGLYATLLLLWLELRTLATWGGVGAPVRWIDVAWQAYSDHICPISAVLSIVWGAAWLRHRRSWTRALREPPDIDEEPASWTVRRRITILTFFRPYWWMFFVGICGGAIVTRSQVAFLLAVPLLVWFLHAAHQLVWAGRLHVRYSGRPYRPGETAVLHLGGAAAASLGELRLTLSCTAAPSHRVSDRRFWERWKGTRWTSDFEERRVLAASATPDSPDAEVEVRFDLPQTGPPSRVSGTSTLHWWEIEVRGRSLGVPYVAHVPLWVHPRADDAPQAARPAPA